MTADDFILTLGRVASNLDHLREFGYPDDYIEKLRTTYTPQLRRNTVPDNDPLIDLLTRYDCSLVEIGMIRLIAQPVEHSWAWIVGKDEADPLILDKGSGQVKIQEFRPGGISEDGYIIGPCAKTSGMFLDAMALTAEFLQRLAIEDEYRTDQDACREMALKCGNAAGGDEYLGQYMTLLGCE